MTEQEAIASATAFLSAREISFEVPGWTLQSSEEAIEVVFNLEMGHGVATMDPPDVRVRVSTASGLCELVDQM